MNCDEKKSFVENAIDISNIEVLKSFHEILIDGKNESFLSYLILIAWQKIRPKSFGFLLGLCKGTIVLDINLLPNSKNDKLSKGHLECGKQFVDGLCDGKFHMKMSVENMNSLAKFVMYRYPRKVSKIMANPQLGQNPSTSEKMPGPVDRPNILVIGLKFTVSDYEDIVHLGTMQQGKIPVIFEKAFWHRFCRTFDFVVDFNSYPVSKNLAHIFTAQPKFKQIGVLLNQLYYIMRKPVGEWSGNPLNRSERFSQYNIIHKDIYNILPAVANCVLLLKNAILYDLYVYIVSGLIYHKGMILEYTPLIRIQNLCASHAVPLITQWLKNLRIWYSTLDPNICNKYKIIPLLQENSWRNKIEDAWDRSCFTLEEFKEYHTACEEFKTMPLTNHFAVLQPNAKGEMIKIYYPEEYVFVCHILDFLISATSLQFDRMINNCIDECLKLVPRLNLREVLHNTIEPEYVDKFAKLVDGVTNPMLRRSFLESKRKYRVLVTRPIIYHGVPANISKTPGNFDYSEYSEEWLTFCKTHKHSLETHVEKLREFISNL